jgi:hypothetical protein
LSLPLGVSLVSAGARSKGTGRASLTGGFDLKREWKPVSDERGRKERDKGKREEGHAGETLRSLTVFLPSTVIAHRCVLREVLKGGKREGGRL